MLEALIFVVFPFSMAFAAVSDLLSMTIQNRVSIVLIASFALIAPLTGMEWSVYAMHWAACVAVLLVTFALFAFGGMGGGDAKLMAATALWMGFTPALLQYLVIAAFLGGLLTLAILAFRASSVSVLTGANRILPHISDSKTGVPYGIALGAAGLIVCPDSALMGWALSQLGG